MFRLAVLISLLFCTFAKMPSVPVTNKVLKLRGGGAVGPIDAELMSKMSYIGPLAYAVQLQFMTPMATKMYMGDENPSANTIEWAKWASIMLSVNALNIFFALKNGLSIADNNKVQVMTWAVFFSYQLFRYSQGMFIDKPSMALSATMAALFWYTAQ